MRKFSRLGCLAHRDIKSVLAELDDISFDQARCPVISCPLLPTLALTEVSVSASWRKPATV